MTRRNRLLTVSVVIAAALFGIVRVASHREPQPKPSVPSADSSAVDAVASETKRSATPNAAKSAANSQRHAAAHVLPNSSVPLDQAIPLLRAFADSGDADAQIELTRRLRICTKHELRASEEADQRDRERIEEDKSDEQLTDELRTARASNLRRVIDEWTNDRRACRDVPSDLLVDWLDPLERAARSGNTYAMLEYARVAIADYDSVNAIVADVDTAIARRDNARAFLLQALLSGDLRSLNDLAYAYFKGSGNAPPLFAVDPFQSYAYAYAGTLAGVSKRGDLDLVMSQNAESLDARQLADAQAQGRRIYERCCMKH